MLSNHVGTIPDLRPTRFWLELSMVVKQERMRSTTKQVICIRFPLKKSLPEDTVTCVTMKETCLWFTRKRYEHLVFAEPIEIRGVKSDGTYCFVCEETPCIEWQQLEWKNNFKPYNYFNSSPARHKSVSFVVGNECQSRDFR